MARATTLRRTCALLHLSALLGLAREHHCMTSRRVAVGWHAGGIKGWRIAAAQTRRAKERQRTTAAKETGGGANGEDGHREKSGARLLTRSGGGGTDRGGRRASVTALLHACIFFRLFTHLQHLHAHEASIV